MEKSIPIEDVVKGFVLMPNYDQAKEYLLKYKEILFGDEAKIILTRLVGNQDGNFRKDLQKVLALLDQCKVVGIDEAFVVAERKARETAGNEN